MPTNVRTNQMAFPYPLGKLGPGADFATKSVPLTQNIVPVDNDGVTPDYKFNGIWIQAHTDNSDTVYVCSNANPPDLTDYTNILGELGPGQWYPRSKEWANNRAINTLFIGAKNAADFAIGSIDQM